jgi:outer membrane protein OmpA-like peptidoglycan-associated protein
MAAVLGSALPAAASDQEGFQIELTPYAWLQGIDGELAAGTREANFDQGIDDLIDNVEAAASGLAVVSINRFVIFGQYDYTEISTNGDGDDSQIVLPPGTKINADLETDIATGAVGWRFDTFGEENTLEVLVGVRDLQGDTELRAANSVIEGDVESTDTIVMLRPSFQLSERWRLNPTFSYAVDGDADAHWEMQPQVQYQFSDYFALRFGYRTLHYEVEEGRKNTAGYRNADVDISGLLIGLGWTFPRHEEEVVAPPPAPAPRPVPAPVAAKCPDADGDGVCDASDACPGTPPGTKVGPAGCDCEFTMRLGFAFDSAELSGADKVLLDDLAARLNDPRLGFVGGEVVGHTDDVGDATYNMGLSERRAQAVAAYLQGKGVKLSDRFAVRGMGETKPLGDNATEEGRAQNRRVTIRRLDCGPG